jgi:Na+-driven multidrug efflux pump
MLNYYLSTLLLVAVTVLPLWLCRDSLLSLYGVKPIAGDALSVIAYETAVTRMKIILGTFLLVSFMNVSGGVLRGLGLSLTPMLINVFSVCGIRVLWVYTVFRLYPTFAALYLSYPVTWMLTFIVMLTIGCVTVKRAIRKRNWESAETVEESE